MAESAAPSPGRIFITYRREETAFSAGWLYDRLAERYGGQVFKDVDSIQLGDDFVEVITRAVGSCDVLLALVGDQWLTITGTDGRRRLDDPDDFVRLEIEAALTRNVRVIPILVDGATMPRADELPPSLARLVRRHALELSPARFEYDTGRLLPVLDRTLAEVRVAQEDAAAVSAPAGKAPDPSTTEPPTAAASRRAPQSPPDAPSPQLASPAPPSSTQRWLGGSALVTGGLVVCCSSLVSVRRGIIGRAESCADVAVG
jgi:TIR domain